MFMRLVKDLSNMELNLLKKPDDGSMKGLAFIKDPDGYWIEILNAEATAGLTK